jgi:hypothetical protein
MTRALCALRSDRPSMPEPARRSVIGITEQLFGTFSAPAAWVGALPLSGCIGYHYFLAAQRPMPATAGLTVCWRRAGARSSRVPSCTLGRPARSWSPAAAVLEACACRRIDLAPDRFSMRRASPSAARRRPTANRPRQWAAIISRSSHRHPRQAGLRNCSTRKAEIAYVHGRLRIRFVAGACRDLLNSNRFRLPL